MRRLVLKMSMSLDAMVGGPDGELDWIFRTLDADATQWVVETLEAAGLHIAGSRTFRDMAAYYPTSSAPYAAAMNQIPKACFSAGAAPAPPTRALTDARSWTDNGATPDAAAVASWRDARQVSGDLADEIARLKQEPGADILAHGGARFASSLVQRGLVDEFRLLVHPVVLGRGLPLFAGGVRPLDLTLRETIAFSGGTVAHVYRTGRAEAAGTR